jgi:hypothetical protein
VIDQLENDTPFVSLRSSDCAVELSSRRDRTSLSRSCALLSLDDASEQLQNGTKPLINGLNKTTLPDTRRVTSCLEVGSLGWRYQADALIDRFGSVLRQVDVKPAIRKLTLSLPQSRVFGNFKVEVIIPFFMHRDTGGWDGRSRITSGWAVWVSSPISSRNFREANRVSLCELTESSKSNIQYSRNPIGAYRC